ncbi:MAG: GNAT family N-acetyltransferase [Gemmatimonadetes bacterium]|nr:GNAT family N-acetyltransferase [Gemmatimonadota bacterium]
MISTRELDIEFVRFSSDLEPVKALFTAYMAMPHHEMECCEYDSASEIESLPEPYVEPRGAILMASLNTQPVGCVALAPFNEHRTCEMRRLYVLPEARGQGIGRTLVEQIMEVARGLGYRVMRLDTAPELAVAIGLYEELGFLRVQTDRGHGACSLSFFINLLEPLGT